MKARARFDLRQKIHILQPTRNRSSTENGLQTPEIEDGSSKLRYGYWNTADIRREEKTAVHIQAGNLAAAIVPGSDMQKGPTSSAVLANWAILDTCNKMPESCSTPDLHFDMHENGCGPCGSV